MKERKEKKKKCIRAMKVNRRKCEILCLPLFKGVQYALRGIRDDVTPSGSYPTTLTIDLNKDRRNLWHFLFSILAANIIIIHLVIKVSHFSL